MIIVLNFSGYNYSYLFIRYYLNGYAKYSYLSVGILFNIICWIWKFIRYRILLYIRYYLLDIGFTVAHDNYSIKFIFNG